MITEKFKTIALIVLGGLLLVALGVGGFLYWKNYKKDQEMEQARVTAQNRIAQLSDTIQENEDTWSRLAQEKEIEMGHLRERNEELAELIEDRDERVASLTEVVANLRTIRVIVNQPTQSEPESGRIRVDFDQTHENFWRVHGFTLTNPAEAEVSVSWTRPANFTLVTTQLSDLSWRSYLSSDIPGLEIGNIETTVNPISRPQEVPGWEEGFFMGIGFGVAVTGNSGMAFGELGYDFGAGEISILGGGIGYNQSADFIIGGGFRLNPFGI